MIDFRGALLPLVSPFVTLSEPGLQALDNHFQLFLRWNDHMNLSAIREPAEIVERHFAESLFCASHLPGDIASVVDIGSGGGFPGIPLAIARPDLSVTLLDSHTRKCVFLREASRSLPNVKVSNFRLESAHTKFDLVVTRGVSWSHMRKFLPNVSNRLLLLSSADEWGGIKGDANWSWQTPVPLPWGNRRFLVTGDLH